VAEGRGGLLRNKGILNLRNKMIYNCVYMILRKETLCVQQ
jgi:hypothetical protein